MSQKNQSGQGADTKPIIIQVPAECKSLIPAVEGMVVAMLEAQKVAHGTRAVDYASVEAAVGAQAAAIERAAHTGILGALEVDTPRLMIAGESYSRIDHALGTYRTLAGDVLSRLGYSGPPPVRVSWTTASSDQAGPPGPGQSMPVFLDFGGLR